LDHWLYNFFSAANRTVLFLKFVSRFDDIRVDIYNINWPKSTVGFNNNHVLMVVIPPIEYKGR
jgi:hypothetical protein